MATRKQQSYNLKYNTSDINRVLLDTGGNELTKRVNTRGIRTGSKRSDEQREADLALISKLLLRENMSKTEIAQEISKNRPYQLSTSMVNIDVNLLLSRWRDTYLSDTDILKGRELRRIDELESAYWDSYERSLKGASSVIENITEFSSEDKIGMDDSNAEETGRVKKATSRKSVSERDGEVRFLNGIQWCINKRCEILGLNAPLKTEMTFDWRAEAQKEGIDPSLVFNEIVKKFVDGQIVE